jgi:hypothetical protein
MTMLETNKPPRRNLDPFIRSSIDEVTETVKAEETARLAEHAKRTAGLRKARLARDSSK